MCIRFERLQPQHRKITPQPQPTHRHPRSETLDDYLGVYDSRLKLMRRNIQTIEARNNRMEVRARNHRKLVLGAETLLSQLELAPDTIESVLVPRLPQLSERGLGVAVCLFVWREKGWVNSPSEDFSWVSLMDGAVRTLPGDLCCFH